MKKGYKHITSIYANFRDEAPYLYEWIVYHLLIGVDHFYLYNHLSKDNYMSVLEPFIEKDIVTLHHHKVESAPKLKKYKHCIENYKNESRWIAFIDLDEFIFIKKEFFGIANFLEKYEQYNGVGLNWLYFGANGHKQKDDKLVLERFTKRETTEGARRREYKTIANPRAIDTSAIRSPHYFIYNNSKKVVSTNQKSLSKEFSTPALYDEAYIAHFKSKSLEEFVSRNALLPRDDGNGARMFRFPKQSPSHRKAACKAWYWKMQKFQNEIEDTIGCSWVEKIKKFNLEEYHKKNKNSDD